jgi:CBS-domain-containing membrane protein
MLANLKGFVAIAAACGITIGLIGLIAVWAGMPLLLASLGPTIAIQTTLPQQPSARPWNVVVGHLIGLGVGVLALYASGAIHVPPFMHSDPLVLQRVAAAAFGVGIGVLIEFLLHASHPPAAATSLFVTLGAVDITWRGIGSVLIGIALVTIFGEIARRLRLEQLRRDAAA